MGRLSSAQARAIDELGPAYMLSADQPLDAAASFGREAPLMLEIGFGTGTSLIAFAQEHKHFNCLGMEVFQPSIANALKAIHATSLTNVRIMDCDARSAVQTMLAPRSLSEVHIYFPDPWPKKRHHKRRLVNAEFIAELAACLRPRGMLRLATDNADYATSMLAVCDAEARLENVAGEGCFALDAGARPSTRFEQRGQALGNRIFDLVFRCRPEGTASNPLS